jgi:tetratricopeptide (TPR) repeat protein
MEGWSRPGSAAAFIKGERLDGAAPPSAIESIVMRGSVDARERGVKVVRYRGAAAFRDDTFPAEDRAGRGGGFRAQARPSPRTGGVGKSRRMRNYIALGAILLLALVLRLIYLSEIADQPLFDTPMGDPWYHDEWTRQIEREGWLGSEPFFRAPLYPYLLALVFRIFHHSYLAPRVLQMGMGILGVFLIYLLSQRIFSDRRVAWLAALFGALYGLFIYFEGELLIPPLLIVLDLGSILLLLDAPRRRGRWRWWAAGALAGLSAIARPNILLFFPFALAWVWWTERREGVGAGPGHRAGVLHAEGGGRRALAGILFCLSGLLVVVAPVTIRNYVVGGDFVLIASQGGINFYLGNNPRADGRTARMPPGEVPDRLIREEQVRLGRPMKMSERSDFWYTRGLRFIVRSPLDAARLLARKVYFLLNGYEIRNNQDIYFFRRYSRLFSLLVWRLDLPGPFVLNFPFGILLPLAAAGMSLGRVRSRSDLLIYLFLASYAISIVLFFVCARYRVPLIPFLMPYAAFALIRGVEMVRRRHFGTLVTPLIVFVVLGLIGGSRLAGVDSDTYAQQHFWNGNAYIRKGEYEAGLREFTATLEIEPGFPLAHLNRGVILHRMGREEEAVAELVREIEQNPGSAAAHHTLAVMLRELGRPNEGLAHALRAHELDPWMTEAEVNLALIYADLGRLAEARDLLASLAVRRPEEESVHAALGGVLSLMGDLAGALAAYGRAADLAPDAAPHQYRLGLLYGRTGNLPLAERHLERAAQLDPGIAPYHADLGTVYLREGKLEAARGEFLRAQQLAPDQAELEHNLGIIALQQGRREDARAHFRRALALNPDLDEAREGLRRAEGRR